MLPLNWSLVTLSLSIDALTNSRRSELGSPFRHEGKTPRSARQSEARSKQWLSELNRRPLHQLGAFSAAPSPEIAQKRPSLDAIFVYSGTILDAG